ncbi:MAG: hypothetical protein AAF721_33085 [Myxococcota bacterium]
MACFVHFCRSTLARTRTLRAGTDPRSTNPDPDTDTDTRAETDRWTPAPPGARATRSRRPENETRDVTGVGAAGLERSCIAFASPSEASALLRLATEASGSVDMRDAPAQVQLLRARVVRRGGASGPVQALTGVRTAIEQQLDRIARGAAPAHVELRTAALHAVQLLSRGSDLE